jgi:hypothetical protein
MSASVKKEPMSSGSAPAQCASSAARPLVAARFSAAMPGAQPANQSHTVVDVLVRGQCQSSRRSARA